jgi:hypothetical protein
MNGTGKSTILRLVNAVSTGDVRVLATAPLRALHLTFRDLPDFRLLRQPGGEALVVWGDKRETISLSRLFADLPEWALLALELHQYDPDQADTALRDYAQELNVPFEEYKQVRDLLRSDPTMRRVDAPAWLPELRAAFPVLFVTDQRLVVEPARTAARASAPARRPRRLAVDAASADIAARIQQADTAYARASQQQDRRFPRDVIQAMRRVQQVSLDDVAKLIGEVDRRREGLRAVGLLDVDSSLEPTLTTENLQVENARPVMATFLQATVAKLDVLSDLEVRLTTFKEFLDSRFSPKSAILSRQDGIRFELPDKSSLVPRNLSSGEQQMMVLAYEILFRAERDTLVIIDEPELSLHVLWQDTLIRDLSRMGSAAGLQFLMATHSPVILAEHPNLERSLDIGTA